MRAVRIGICEESMTASKQLVHWIKQYCHIYALELEIVEYYRAEDFFKAFSLRRFEAVFMGFAGPEGFLCARRLREGDKAVKLVFIADTANYAVSGVRLHFTDYLIRPVEFKHIVRAMKLMGIGV